jgi:hypothetical protein
MHAQLSEISPELAKIVGSDPVDFITKAKRRFPAKMGIAALCFGTFWTFFTSIFVVALAGMVLSSEPSMVTINGQPTEVSSGDYQALIVPILVVALFMAIGLGMMGFALWQIFSPGAYFIATPTHLIEHRGSSTKLYSWAMFSGNMEIKENTNYGYIILNLHTVQSATDKNRRYFVADVIHMSGIDQVGEVFEVVRKRILANSRVVSEVIPEASKR